MIENACFTLAILSVLLVPGYVLYVFSRLFFKATMEHISEAPLRAAYAARRGTPVKTKKILKTIGIAIGYCIGGIILAALAIVFGLFFGQLRRDYRHNRYINNRYG